MINKSTLLPLFICLLVTNEGQATLSKATGKQLFSDETKGVVKQRIVFFNDWISKQQEPQVYQKKNLLPVAPAEKAHMRRLSRLSQLIEKDMPFRERISPVMESGQPHDTVNLVEAVKLTKLAELELFIEANRKSLLNNPITEKPVTWIDELIEKYKNHDKNQKKIVNEMQVWGLYLPDRENFFIASILEIKIQKIISCMFDQLLIYPYEEDLIIKAHERGIVNLSCEQLRYIEQYKTFKNLLWNFYRQNVSQIVEIA